MTKDKSLKARRQWAAKQYERKIQAAKCILNSEPSPDISHLLSIRQEIKKPN